MIENDQNKPLGAQIMFREFRRTLVLICALLLAAEQSHADLVYTAYSGSQNGVTVRDATTLEQYFFFDPGFPINGIAAGENNELYLTSGNTIYRYTNAGERLAEFSWTAYPVTYTSTTLGNGSLYTAYQGNQTGVTVRDQNTLVQSQAILTEQNNGIGSNLEDNFYRVFDNQIVRMRNDNTVLESFQFTADPNVVYTHVDVGEDGFILVSYTGAPGSVNETGVTVRDITNLAQARVFDPGFATNGLAAGASNDVYLTTGNNIYRYDTFGNVLNQLVFPDAGVVYGDIAFAPGALPPVNAPEGTATLLQANPDASTADITVFTALVVGEAEAPIEDIEILQAASCVDGQLADPTTFGVIDVPDTFLLDEQGEAYISAPLPGEPDTFVAARLINEAGSSTVPGQLSQCFVAGPDNDSWVRAAAIELSSVGDGVAAGDAEGYVDAIGVSRWYKFAIQPGSEATIRLSNLPEDYDLAVFTDIRQAFNELAGDADVDGLNLLGAEFAPQRFSPQRFSPDQYSADQIAPDAFSEDAFAPQRFSASSYAADAYFPQRFSGDEYSPQRFSDASSAPQRFSPQRFSPQRFSPDEAPPAGFTPENYVNAQSRSLISASAQFGTAAEASTVNTWNNTGDFYLRVNGKNGVFSLDAPFKLDVEIEGGGCELVVQQPPSAFSAPGSGYETLVLYDSRQLMLSGASDEALTLLEAKLDELAARSEVAGVVQDLHEIASIQALHDQADLYDSCPYAANLTASAIRDVIALYRQANPELKYIVLAGGDDSIPFFRKPDIALLGPEENYEPPMRDGTQSQAALRLNYVLTQDDYGSSVAPSYGDSVVAVPDLAVGRLVETIDEMVTVVDAYLSTDAGVVDATDDTLVTGYDFLEDTSNAIQSLLVEGTNADPAAPVATNRTLISDAALSPNDPASWTADQLRSELFEGADIMFLAGHFSANSALAADYASTVIVTEIDQSDLDLANTLVYSAGCHSGYNIVNPDSVPGVTLQLDWPQTFARKGATLIAGTGYQYGDTEFIEYSERLYVEFTKALRRNTGGPVAVGDALVAAKQSYLAKTPELKGLHRKSLQISTLFGLPMLKINLPFNPLDVADADPEPLVEDVLEGPGRPLSAGGLGLQKAMYPLVFDGTVIDGVQITEQVKELVDGFDISGGRLQATYLQGPDGVLASAGEPAIPLVSRDVSVTGQSLRGVGFRGGKWTERDVIPLTGAPTTELRGVHVPLRSAINIPLQLATPNYFGALADRDEGQTILHVTPAQHRAAAAGNGMATLREFSELNFDLYYSSNTITYANGNRPALASPPAISGIRAVTFDDQGTDDAVRFIANVVGDPSAGIQEVWVTYTEGSPVPGIQYEWLNLGLAQDVNDSRVWSAEIPASVVDDFTSLQYAIHAVNGVGLVSTNDNYGRYYSIAGRFDEVGEDGQSEVTLESSLSLSGSGSNPVPTSGPYNGLLDLEAALEDSQGLPVAGEIVQFQLGQGVAFSTTDANGVAKISLPLTSAPGIYELNASFAGNAALEGSSASSPFEIERVDTVIELVEGEQVVGVEGVDTGVTAILEDAAGNRLPEETVYFTIEGGPDGDIIRTAITNNVGIASLGDVALPATAYRVNAQFLGNLPTGEEIADPVFNPAYDSITLNLLGGKNCPTGPVKGKVFMKGFCYLVHLVDGKVYMFNGTLVIGSTTLVVDEDGNTSAVTSSEPVDEALEASADGELDLAADELSTVIGEDEDLAADNESEVIEAIGMVNHRVSQFGAGGVVIYEKASVRRKVWELGEGGITVYGTVGGGMIEFGNGSIEVLPPASVRRNIIEFGDGDVVIGGTGNGSADQAVVDGHVTEIGAGNLVVTPAGFVDGNVTEIGPGEAIVEPGSVSGHIRER